MSDTPRTDAYEHMASIRAVEYGCSWNPVEFARELERAHSPDTEQQFLKKAVLAAAPAPDPAAPPAAPATPFAPAVPPAPTVTASVLARSDA